METFVQAFLLPQKLHPVHLALGKAEQDTMLRKPELQSHFDGMRDVDEVVVLICGHGGRDKRCGDMGPLLQWQFKEVLPKQGFHVCENESNAEAPNELAAARVGLISHIGGHKFAGNVIVYIPPRYLDESGQRSPLAGRGIWYGRVEPKHVEGIVRETILQGRVISELFRGAVGQGETIMDL
ncbi:MAG: hypothetical protein M1812_007057 [Candelaria pacifica]|nr:MAG: hypothetical protein M1812_007057 [Candelaria pacifica]